MSYVHLGEVFKTACKHYNDNGFGGIDIDCHVEESSATYASVRFDIVEPDDDSVRRYFDDASFRYDLIRDITFRCLPQGAVISRSRKSVDPKPGEIYASFSERCWTVDMEVHVVPMFFVLKQGKKYLTSKGKLSPSQHEARRFRKWVAAANHMRRLRVDGKNKFRLRSVMPKGSLALPVAMKLVAE